MEKLLEQILHLTNIKMTEMVGNEYVMTYDSDLSEIIIELNLVCTMVETNSLALYLVNHLEKSLGDVVNIISKTPKSIILGLRASN